MTSSAQTADQPVQTGIVFRASHPKVGVYWNFLRFAFRIDGVEQMEMVWNADTFAAVADGPHELTVVGKPITRVGPSRANARLTVDFAPGEVVWVHYRGPAFALAFLGWAPLCRAKLTVIKRARVVPQHLPGVASSIEEVDRRPR